jgi:simple sugar transport system permease protein
LRWLGFTSDSSKGYSQTSCIGLISRGNLLAVPFVAFFIAVLEVGASALQRTMMIPVEMVFIIEALVLLFVLLSDVVRRR